MKLRDLSKTNSVNDGTRLLVESILVPEVAKAFADWKKFASEAKCVLIGGVALSHYVKPRTTTDADLLFMSKDDIPLHVEGFKKTRNGAFMHKETHVEIEVLTPEAINMPEDIAKAIYDTAIVEDGIKIASPSGLAVSKLGRFKLQDQADIEALCAHSKIDVSAFPISQEWKDKFLTIC